MTPEEIIDGIDRLVSLPEALTRVNQLLDSNDADISEIGEVIAHDTALTARLLKLVNSAFYSFPAQIDTITRAITLIGTDELRSLTLASAASTAFDKIDTDLVDMGAFWLRSVYCGLVAKKIMAVSAKGRGETQFLSGLLHDVGKLVLFLRIPEQTNALFKEAQASEFPLPVIERERLGFSSAEVGVLLLQTWQLPPSLCEPIRFQHDPGRADQYQAEAWVLNVALDVTNKIEPELKTDLPTTDLSGLDANALKVVGLNGEQIDAIVQDANLESFEVLGIINPGAATIY